SMWTIDAHEHLPPEQSPISEQKDFYSLFEHYCQGDLVAAGASGEDLAVFADRERPLSERWERFSPFLSTIRGGGYARAALLVVRDILGYADLNDDTFEAVSDALQQLNRPGLYEYILKERCRIAACIECWCLDKGPYPDYFYHIAPGTDVLDLGKRDAVQDLARKCDRDVTVLDDVLECMDALVEDWNFKPHVVGIKIPHAYSRSLDFQQTDPGQARRLFERVMRDDDLEASDFRPLQDFLMFALVERAASVDLPVVIHTGLQAGNFHRIADGNPLHLQSLLETFPRARFDLLHGGMPWVRETAALAKQFPGVYLSMAWMHIISPFQSRSALSEWLDMLPNNKIFGFGGDYRIVEKVYGHLVLARQNIAAVLAGKIRHDAMSHSDALVVARRLFHDNPRDFYGL
ncbi:MAG: amidohydrolase family protein, partial [Candidatus Sumerlaeota bacterium]